MSLLIFLIVLGVLVIVHEFGHFAAARFLKIGVERFSIGFGPKLFSKSCAGTEFLVSAIPLGGYVKLAGDERAQCKGTPEEFFSHPVWHRVMVVIMGPVVNFIFAYLCFFFLFFVAGYPVYSNQIGSVMEGYPAVEAGFQPGDRVLAINNVPVANWAELQNAVMQSKGEPISFVIERDGQQQTIADIAPRMEVVTEKGQEHRYPVVGIKPVPEFLKYGFGRSLIEAGNEIWKTVSMTMVALYRVVTGSMSAKDTLAGPIRIFEVIKDASALGFAYLVFIVAVISASLGLFNLFPIPVLDGGHILFLAIEAVRGRPLSPKLEENFTKAGFAVLMSLMVFVFYNDIAQMGWIDHIKTFLGETFR